MSNKRWVISGIDKELCKELSAECEIDPFTALLLGSRGITDPLEIDEFLSDEPEFNDPSAFLGMDKAVERIQKAIDSFERIAIYGDYDVDGITSTALLYSYLSSKGADVMFYIPDRIEEGYGMNKQSIEKLNSHEVTLIITVDNGINASVEIDYAATLGMDVVVTDHHIPSGGEVNAAAIVNPHREGCESPYKSYAGVGVAYNLVCALEGCDAAQLLAEYGDLVTLGTIADVMPLTGENRKFVKHGLQFINSHSRIGLTALIKAAGLSEKAITAGSVAFMLAPRLNAAGRIGLPDRAVNLLLTDNEEYAEELAIQLNSENTGRQQMEAEILAEVTDRFLPDGKVTASRVIVVAGEGWHHGVIGLVAARLCEKFGKPAIAFSVGDKEAVGSARSIADVSIHELIDGVSDLVTAFGGHKSAAGLTIETEKLKDFIKAINTYAAEIYPEMPFPELRLDCKLNPAALSVDTVHAQRILEPFGCGNPTPIFGLYGFNLTAVTPVGGGKHLRLSACP
ncbi:MAG: single-stranded-DNA-specific exonuclease RecJ, partial [Clostridiales bacterium 43-6]